MIEPKSTRAVETNADLRGRLVIVCGLPGAGKTTHARRLVETLGSVNAMRMCPDDWIEALGLDLNDEPLRDRVEQLQWTLGQQLLTAGMTVIIEWGTWGRWERDRLRLGARALGAAVELHYLTASVDELFARVTARGMENPPIRHKDLLRWQEIFETPTAEELALFDEPA